MNPAAAVDLITTNLLPDMMVGDLSDGCGKMTAAMLVVMSFICMTTLHATTLDAKDLLNTVLKKGKAGKEVATMHVSDVLDQPAEERDLELGIRMPSKSDQKAIATALTSGPRPWGARA